MKQASVVKWLLFMTVELVPVLVSADGALMSGEREIEE